METTRIESTAPAAAPRRARGAERAAGPRGRARSEPRARSAKVAPRAPVLDYDALLDLEARFGRALRAVLRDHPYVVVGGVFGAGLIIGGRSVGRFARIAAFEAGRYLVMNASDELLGSGK